ncbi:MAG: hypothetical protein E3I12_02405, partial [Hadesarchaea archaeon]
GSVMRVKTGISGLDELMEGGLPTGSCVLLSGKVGTGKSIFAMQYILKGIADYGEPGVLVSLERDKQGLYDYASKFEWQLQRLENEGSLRILGGPISNVVTEMKKAKAKIGELLSEIVETVKASGSRRVVLERVDLLSMFFPEERDFKIQLDNLRDRLAKLNCTSIATSEIREGREELSRGGAEQILDGAIVLYYNSEGLEGDRALEIRKMRGIGHSNRLHLFNITDNGIVIQKLPGKRKPKLPGEVERAIEPAISLRALRRSIIG